MTHKVKLGFHPAPSADEILRADDIDRMERVLDEAGFCADRADLLKAWNSFSDRYEASWMEPPGDDQELLSELLGLLSQVE